MPSRGDVQPRICTAAAGGWLRSSACRENKPYSSQHLQHCSGAIIGRCSEVLCCSTCYSRDSTPASAHCCHPHIPGGPCAGTKHSGTALQGEALDPVESFLHARWWASEYAKAACNYGSGRCRPLTCAAGSSLDTKFGNMTMHTINVDCMCCQAWKHESIKVTTSLIGATTCMIAGILSRKV